MVNVFLGIGWGGGGFAAFLLLLLFIRIIRQLSYLRNKIDLKCLLNVGFKNSFWAGLSDDPINIFKITEAFMLWILYQEYVEYRQIIHTVWCNQMKTVFSEMSSWTALTRHLGTKTTFETKYKKKANMFGFALWWF